MLQLIQEQFPVQFNKLGDDIGIQLERALAVQSRGSAPGVFSVFSGNRMRFVGMADFLPAGIVMAPVGGHRGCRSNRNLSFP